MPGAVWVWWIGDTGGLGLHLMIGAASIMMVAIVGARHYMRRERGTPGGLRSRHARYYERDDYTAEWEYGRYVGAAAQRTTISTARWPDRLGQAQDSAS